MTLCLIKHCSLPGKVSYFGRFMFLFAFFQLLFSCFVVVFMMKSRRMRWAGHVARMGEKRNAYKIFVGKRPLDRPRRSWVDSIRLDFGEIAWDGVYWIDVAQDRDQWKALVSTVMNLRVP
jgi:hypothetical protein